MLKQYVTILTLCLILSATLYRCTRDKNHVKSKPGTPSQNNYQSPVNGPAQMQAQNQPPVQAFSMDASVSQTITTLAGAQITFEQGAFLSNGSPITSGNIKVEVQEINDRSVMVLAGLPSQTDNGLLESAGMVQIKASLGSQSLSINPTKPPFVLFPAWGKTSLTGYEGFKINTHHCWEPTGDTSTIIIKNGKQYLSIPVRQDGWFNLDRQYVYNPSYDIRVKLDDTLKDSAVAYVVINYLRSAVKLYWDPLNNEFNIGSKGYAGFPDTVHATVIIATVHNNDFYECDTIIKPKSGLVLQMRPKPRNYYNYITWLKSIYSN